MESGQWDRLQGIFAMVVDLPADRQQAAVREECKDDREIERDLLEMLKEDAGGSSLLDTDLAVLATTALHSDVIRSLVQREIGPYRFLRLLGEGGMGVVYLAERTDIGGQVAIKLLRDAWLSPMRRERFLAEQRTLARLNHRAIAHIFDTGMMDDGTPWFVMEYADGLPLTEHLRACNSSVPEALLLFRAVCEAVQHAHSLAIIHRDLKPSNIFVTKAGEVKLLDFGIAKSISPQGEDGPRTVDGLRLMSPTYAAPEQLTGGAVGLFTDVYALGVLLYEILAGCVPARLHSGAEAPPKPSHAAGSTSPYSSSLSRAQWADLDVLCLTAMQHQPDRRYRSVDALSRDVQAYLDGRALEARADSPLYAAGKFMRRHRAPLLGTACGLLLFAAIITAFMMRLADSKDAALAEAARTNRILEFTEDLFDGGDPVAGPRKDLKVVEVLNRGRQQAETLRNDPRLQADLFVLLGTAYEKLGHIGTADQLLRQAVAERKRQVGNKDRDYAKSLMSLAELRKEQHRLPEAEGLLRQAIAIEEQTRPNGDNALERSHAMLGAVAALGGDYGTARAELETAIREHPADQRPSEQFADDLTQLAEVHHYLGGYDEAERLSRQAMAINIALFGRKHPTVAQNLSDLGAIALNRGDPGEAEQLDREALNITADWYGPDHPAVADALTTLSTPLIELGRQNQAEAALMRALAIEVRAYGEGNASEAISYNELGSLAYTRDQDDLAEKDFRAALTIWTRVYGEHHQFVGLSYANLAGVYMDRKNYPGAEAMCRKALAVYAVALPGANVNTAVAHVKLGRTLMHEAKYAEAEPESLAGYRYFLKNAAPGDAYLRGARKDLADIEQHLGQPQLSAQYRREMEIPEAR